MFCRIADMREKQVICIKSGIFLGCVGDVEIDTCNGRLVNIVIFGKPKYFGLFGRCDDIVLPWNCIEVIGRDVMLVNFEPPAGPRRPKRGLFSGLFSGGYTN